MYDISSLRFKRSTPLIISCSVDRASLYNLVNETNLLHNLFLVYFANFIYNLYMLLRNEEVLLRVKEQRNILHEICKRKANWIGHILRRNCLLTYLLTPWSRVLLQKLTGVQLVKKFPVFYGTRRFITALTSARHLSLS